jgi:hypothetical protein
VLAVGDAGEGGMKVEYVLGPRGYQFGNCSIFTCDDDVHPRHNRGGNLELQEHVIVEFVGGTVQLPEKSWSEYTPLRHSGGMKEFAVGLEPESMCVLRGTIRHGNRDWFFATMHTTGMCFDL